MKADPPSRAPDAKVAALPVTPWPCQVRTKSLKTEARPVICAHRKDHGCTELLALEPTGT
jgi:hypothetical protein